jgi:hypothetical protein
MKTPVVKVAREMQQAAQMKLKIEITTDGKRRHVQATVRVLQRVMKQARDLFPGLRGELFDARNVGVGWWRVTKR